MKAPEKLFRAICFGFSVLLLVLSLLLDARLAALNDLAAEREREAARLRTENARLRARCESNLSLEEIERYAREELGMQSLSGEQMIPAEEPVG